LFFHDNSFYDHIVLVVIVLNSVVTNVITDIDIMIIMFC
jgi:hypothetical protein